MIFLLRSVMIFQNTGFLSEIEASHNCLQRTLRKYLNDSFNEVARNF